MSISELEESTFRDVACFLNIHVKTTTLSTLFDLKREFATHHSQDDIKSDGNDDDSTLYDDVFDLDEEMDSVHHREQFLSFIRPSTNDTSASVWSQKLKRYSKSRLSKSVMGAHSYSSSRPLSPLFELNKNDDMDVYNHKHYIQKQLKTVASLPMNIFADPRYICCKDTSNINWQFGFVQITAQWRPEFMEVIKFKQFNLKKASEIFNNGQEFIKSDAHKGWQNIYWFFDRRSLETKKNQKNATSGMKQYLNDYKDGIILKFNHNVNIPQCDKKQFFKSIGDDEAINKTIICGVLRAYCHCDVVEWNSKINPNALLSNNEKIICLCCNKQYSKPNDDEKSTKSYWIQGIAKKHDNLKVFLCGKCIIELVLQGTDTDLVNIFQYLTDSLTNNRKITELCLVHRLFANSSQLMQLLINSFCQNWEESETAGMLKVINFVIKWIDFLWFEDFRKESKARVLLNRFISFLLQETNGKTAAEYVSIYKATQKLIKTYRDQYLLQQQLDAEVEANLKIDRSSIRTSSPPDGFHNISSKVMLQNMDLNDVSDSDTNYFQFDTDKKEDVDNCIPSDLSWFDVDDNMYGNEPKFFKYILQKRVSLKQFREYEYNALREINTTVSIPLHKRKTPPVVTSSKQKNVIIKTLSNPETCTKGTKSAFGIFNKTSTVHSESVFLQSHCYEFAAQLTLVTFDLFRAIRPTELLCKAWTKKDKHVTAPNIAELIIFMESMAVWAKFEIAVAEQDYRKKTIERIARIGIELFKLGNQYGAVQIYLSLVSSDLKWFKHDMDILYEMEDVKLFMDKIEKLINISRNHASLRRRLWNLSSPAIPYLGVFLKDAFQADELLRIGKMQKVNPKQMALLYGVYDKIELFRTGSYSKTIKRNDIIIRYIHRQLHRSKKINVKALSRFCKQQSAEERTKKKTFWS